MKAVKVKMLKKACITEGRKNPLLSKTCVLCIAIAGCQVEGVCLFDPKSFDPKKVI